MRLIDAEELGFRILEETSDKDETANKIYGLVINAPTIEPKIGRWIKGLCDCICSCCSVEEVYTSNFCPNCGAKMENGNEVR